MELEVPSATRSLSAERTADDVRAQASREADLIVEEARVEGPRDRHEAETERERILTEIRRLRSLEIEVRADYRAFLLAALDRLEGDTVERRASDQAA